jgi:hypothetical protein
VASRGRWRRSRTPTCRACPPEFAARLSVEDLGDIASGDIPLGTVQAFEQAAITREVEDLKEFSRRSPPSWSSTPVCPVLMPSLRPPGSRRVSPGV